MDRHIITAPATTPHSSKRLLFLSATLALAAVFTPLSHAQEAPVGNRRMGYAQLNDVLYVQGGFDSDTLSHLFSLDLSTSWSVPSVPWTKLRDGQSTSHLALVPVDAASNGGSQGSLLAIGGMGNPTLPAFFSQFDVGAGSWSNLTSVKSPYPHLEGHAAVSDPNTGLVYLVGGSGDNDAYNLLTVYDPRSRSMVSHQPATAANSITDAAAVWSSVRNTILTFGGTRAPPATVQGMGGDGVLSEYDPSTKEWKTMATTGDIPPARLDHCMTASEDGSKIVVFGGSDANEYFGTVYILDVKSAKWKQGRAAPVARTRMACAFHSYQLIAWGGSSGSNRNTMLPNIPSVYSLNQNKWTQNYTVDEKEGTTSTGGIVGGIFAIALIGACIGIYIMRKRKRRREEASAFHSDAMAAAAAVAGENGNDNVKVLAPPHAQSQYANAPIDSYGMYANGQGNDYPLSKMEVGDPHKVEATHVRYNEGYHDGVSGSGSTAASVVGSGHGSEKAQSPGYYYGAGSVASTPMLQSPATTYQMHSQYSPHQGYHQADANPFTSPNNYHHYDHAGAMSPTEPDPFMRATVAVSATATEFHSPQQTNGSASPSDPFNQYQHSPQQQYQHYTSPWPTAYQGQASPSPGARAPQVIPDYNNDGSSGYVPPP
ncbi:hypothetical protein BG011_008735 [Mortierella polycephala]|uniref:Galactose oxidase n=1 Tax=Mortierella polycephala TaxID=41804 RepID=A0A9P6PP41_9FUNG|nr:hypothetical protein BG011_008735 [Mortierella polycephala]